MPSLPESQGVQRMLRFKLDGETFELTREAVTARLRGHQPEEVREHWVDIDGTRWPVKQVIALATGVSDRSRFQSQSSRRWLMHLGFPIGGGSTASPLTGRSRSTQRRSLQGPSFDAAALEEIEVVDVRVTFSWLRVGAVVLDDAGLPRFPRLPRAPGLYRFDFGSDDSGTRVIYIGESVDLARRARNYRNAKSDRSRQKTSRRLHKEIVQHLSAGKSIELAVATKIRLADDQAPELRLKSARRLAENAAVLIAQTAPATRALNIDADLTGMQDPEER